MTRFNFIDSCLIF